MVEPTFVNEINERDEWKWNKLYKVDRHGELVFHFVNLNVLCASVHDVRKRRLIKFIDTSRASSLLQFLQ